MWNKIEYGNTRRNNDYVIDQNLKNNNIDEKEKIILNEKF